MAPDRFTALLARMQGTEAAGGLVAHRGRALLSPDEVRNLPQGRKLLFLAGLRPIVADKLRYYADPEFAGSFDPA
jgi:type IV secretory pathway TraG/TraD family ATPase VirD4